MSARPEILEGIPFFQTLDGDERAAVAFWSSVADDAGASDADRGRGRSESAQGSSG